MNRWYFNIPSQPLYFRHVKVYNTANYKVVHNFDYAASILSLGLAVRSFFCRFFFFFLSFFNSVHQVQLLSNS